MKTSFAVIGGDSLVGRNLGKSLLRRGNKVYLTTRRANNTKKNFIYLDFEDNTSYLLPEDVNIAIIVAAATNYIRCATDEKARVINEILIPKLAQSLLYRDIFVIFISTNSVFGGNIPWPDEYSPHCPTIPYALQKHNAEKSMHDFAENKNLLHKLCIVRLTKIISPTTPPFPSWFSSWSEGKFITPFSDFLFAPLSEKFVGNALAVISEKQISGNLHISGADNVSYVDFANEIALQMGIPREYIKPITSEKAGVHVDYKPLYSGIGMERTTRLTGILPQQLSDAVSDLIEAKTDMKAVQ